MADVTIDMIGLKELELMLKNMPDQFNYTFLTGAHKTALKPFIAEAKARAPVGTKSVVSKKYSSRTHDPGNLRDSIGVGLAPKSRKLAGVWAGPRASQFKGKKRIDGYYAHMVEFGHGKRSEINPHPFMRPAWDVSKEGIKKNITEVYIARMKKHIRKWMKNVRG